MKIIHKPIMTEVFEDPRQFQPIENSTYFLMHSGEPRSEHVNTWKTNAQNTLFLEVLESTEQRENTFSVRRGGVTQSYSLRSLESLEAFWSLASTTNVYLDITGMPHHIWAPLLKSGFSKGKYLRVVYAEPLNYRQSETPYDGEFFDLSSRIKGISPIPQFITFDEISEDLICFIPLLGFQGTRLAYITEQVQPLTKKTFPIVGVPGFRPEYSFYAYIGNRTSLLQEDIWRNVRFSSANCPFSLYYLLDEISDDYPNHLFKVAIIGTKPHALGAILFSLISGKNVELIYDYPLMNPDRIEGLARIFEYDVTALAQDIPNRKQPK